MRPFFPLFVEHFPPPNHTVLRRHHFKFRCDRQFLLSFGAFFLNTQILKLSLFSVFFVLYVCICVFYKRVASKNVIFRNNWMVCFLIRLLGSPYSAKEKQKLFWIWKSRKQELWDLCRHWEEGNPAEGTRFPNQMKLIPLCLVTEIQWF